MGMGSITVAFFIIFNTFLPKYPCWPWGWGICGLYWTGDGFPSWWGNPFKLDSLQNMVYVLYGNWLPTLENLSSSNKQKPIMSHITEVLVSTSLTRSLVVLGLVFEPSSVCLSAVKMTGWSCVACRFLPALILYEYALIFLGLWNIWCMSRRLVRHGNWLFHGGVSEYQLLHVDVSQG